MQSPRANFPDQISSFYIDWHLLDGCNHECSYNHEPASALQEKYYREPLLEAAYTLLSLQRPNPVVHFYGGEPTIHPHFPELFRYIATSGKQLNIVLDTNGLRSPDYYKKLLQGIRHGILCCNIDVHLKYLTLEQLLPLMALIIENKQHCRVVINHVSEYARKAETLYQKLAIFSRQLPFALEIRLPLGGDPASAQAAMNAFTSVAAPVRLPAWAITARMPLATPQHAGSGSAPYCCLGATSVHVTPEGKLTLGLAAEDDDFHPRVMKLPLMRPGFPQIPSFPSHADAEAWLKAFGRTALRQELDGGAIRHPRHTGMTDEQRLRQRL